MALHLLLTVMSTATAVSKTVAVLGASYGGARAAQVLAKGLPKGWRLVVIDRNSHMNHLYVLPRFAIVSGHEHKAFIPYKDMLGAQARKEHIILHAQVLGLTPTDVHLSRAFPEHGIEGPTPTLRYDYMVYALGSHLPAPIDLWGPVDDPRTVAAVKEGQESSSSNVSAGLPAPLITGTKAEGIQWLKRYHDRIERAPSILVVGGGALGVQYATDIAEVYPSKSVTLLHSREQLLPRFSRDMHEAIMSRVSALNINAILGDRLDLSSLLEGKTAVGENGVSERVVRTQSGREVRASLILLCTGQTPNTAVLAKALPDAVAPAGASKGMIRVARTLQVAVPDASGAAQTHGGKGTVLHPHIFAIGDAADAFGSINNGRAAYFQAEIAARNILKMIEHREGGQGEPQLESYEPAGPGIKLSLGIKHSVYEMDGKLGKKDDGVPDMHAAGMWELYGVEYTDDVSA